MRASGVIRGADWAELLRESLAQSPADTAAWMEQHTHVLKRDRYSKAGLLELNQQACFMKFYLAKSPWQQLGFRLRYGRGIRSFDAALEMARAGLAVPSPRACLLVSGGLVLLTEAIEAGSDLRTLWQELALAEQAAKYMSQAGETLAALHRAGFAHGDCKWSNLLWSGETFYLVDLEAVRRVGFPAGASPAPGPRQTRDLARFTVDAERLGATPEQYDAFLVSYCSTAKSPRAALAGTIQSAAEPIRRRHAAKYRREYRRLL